MGNTQKVGSPHMRKSNEKTKIEKKIIVADKYEVKNEK